MPERSDLERDLILLRVLEAPRPRIWQAWTRPVMLQKWFCPSPLHCQVASLDLQPGGSFEVFRAVPGGMFEQQFSGCFLEVVNEQWLVFTDAMIEGFRPAIRASMTVEVMFEDHPRGTAQTIRAICKDRAERDRQASLGFYENWGQSLDQLADLARWHQPVQE